MEGNAVQFALPADRSQQERRAPRRVSGHPRIEPPTRQR